MFPLHADLSFHVTFLDGVACNLAVAVIFGRFPLQRSIEAPHVGDMHVDRRAWLFWKDVE